VALKRLRNLPTMPAGWLTRRLLVCRFLMAPTSARNGLGNMDEQRRECPELFFSTANSRRPGRSVRGCTTHLRASVPVFASPPPAGIRASARSEPLVN
jgi:hypothetical protein